MKEDPAFDGIYSLEHGSFNSIRRAAKPLEMYPYWTYLGPESRQLCRETIDAISHQIDQLISPLLMSMIIRANRARYDGENGRD